jgi:hypothetical protein
MASGIVDVYIPDLVIEDYQRRDVFPGAAAMKVDVKYLPARSSAYTIPLTLAYLMYDDAIEQRVNRAPTTHKTLYTDYGRLMSFIKNETGISAMVPLAWAPDYGVAPRAWKRAKDEVIYQLFTPLGIKAVEVVE